MAYARITNIKVRNYQSIGATDLVIDGFTVIVGRGNLGKSGLLRAICAALFNETGTGNIRDGTKECSVELGFGDDTLLWTKPASGSARYSLTIDGKSQEYTKLGANVPDDVREYLGVRDIEIDKTFSMRPQVHGQFDSPLLLAESSGKAARALSKLTKLEIVMQAQVAAARDLRRAKSEISTRTNEITELEEREKEFPDMDRLDTRITRARGFIDTADQRLTVLGQAEDAYHLMIDAYARLVVEPPAVADLSKLIKRIDDMQHIILAMKVCAQAQNAMELAGQALKRTAADHVDCQDNLTDFMRELEICPVCGKPISEEHDA